MLVADARMAPASTDDPTRKASGGTGWRLLVYYEGGSSSFELPAGKRLVIGRADDTDVQIPHDSVSRRHAELSTERGWRITDLGSSNGTIVGTAQLRKGQSSAVDPGVIVRIGDARLLVDWAAAGTPAERPSAEPAPPSSRPDSAETPMGRVMRLVQLVAPSTLPVFVLGETGVGKGWIAQEIHRRSPRADAPFVRVNCAALPEPLLESELFGHERGAFTGAVQTKPGILETATGGTVLLDEIGEAPASTQAKLLHVLEHGELLRLGATKPRPVDVRFIAATNREIDALMSAGAFRRDLYFRLAGVPLRVPPLRERTDEIAAIARGASTAPLSREAIDKLVTYAWPGNIRELRNVVARAALLSGGGEVRARHVVFDDLQPQAQRPARPEAAPEGERAANRTLGEEIRGIERDRIVAALERYGGHQGKAAEHLGISRRTLTNKLNELGLPRPRKGR
jgi:DNA-binding NtrC family response regulator